MSISKELTILSEQKYDELSKQTYPFENLVFNGGGALCIAEIGFLQVFDDLGLRSAHGPQIQRYAGNSGGALVAGLAAVGYTGQELIELVNDTNFQRLVEGKRFGIFSKIADVGELLTHHGIYTAKGVESFLVEKIEKKTGNGQITFKEKIELTLTSVDVVREECVFFHPKTQPDVPIATAMRMSMSIPVIFTPMKKPGDNIGIFVDGGIMCNYPIMSYDGWYLSMAKDQGFLDKYHEQRQAIDNQHDRRFLGNNHKTLGAMVYNAYEQDVLTAELDIRTDYHNIKRPSTKLANERKNGVDAINGYKKTQLAMSAAMDRLAQAVPIHNIRKASITLEELRKYKAPEEASTSTTSQEDEDEKGSSEQGQKLLESVDKLTKLIQSIPDLKASISTLEGMKKGQKGTDKGPELGLQNTSTATDTRHAFDSIQGYMDHVAGLSSSLEEAKHMAMTEIFPPKEILAIILLLAVKPSSEKEYPVLKKTQHIFHQTVDQMKTDIDLMFGSYPNIEDLFQKTQIPDEIQFVNIENWAEKKAKGILDTIQQTLEPVAQMEVKGLKNYLVSITETQTTRITRGMMTEKDKKRTVGINTDYIKTLDFSLEEADKDYIIKRAKQATVEYLRWYSDQPLEHHATIPTNQ